MSEELTVIHPFIKKHLSRFFEIEHEVEFFEYGPRADFILTCQITGLRLGIECKGSELKRGSKVYDWIMQTQRYSEKFKIPFFVFPHIQNRVFFDSNRTYHDRLGADNNISTFIGKMGVGELLLEKRECRGNDYKHWKFVHSGKVICTISNNNFELNEKNYHKIMQGV